MPRIALDLNQTDDLKKVKGQWRVGPGLVPGEPNEGLKAQMLNTPARLSDYDDSRWEVCTNIRKSLSVGFTFAWYRITVEIPGQVDGVALTDSRVLFETNVDNYGEIWGRRQDRSSGGCHRRHQCPAARRSERQGRRGRQARHRLPGSERPAGRAARRCFYALRDSRLRVSRLGTHSSFSRFRTMDVTRTCGRRNHGNA